MFSYLQSLLVLYSLEILWNRDIGLETLFSAILVYICSFVKELFAGRGQAPPLPYTVEHLGRVW